MSRQIYVYRSKPHEDDLQMCAVFDESVQKMNDEPDVKMLDRYEMWKHRVASIADDDKTVHERRLAEILNMDFDTLVAAHRAFNRDKISPEELGALFSMSTRAVKGLPLKQYTPFEQTPTGYRQVVRFRRQDVLAFLTACNPAYGLYAFDEPLLKADFAANLCGEFGVAMSVRKLKELRGENRGPEFVALNTREIRYRPSDVLSWLENPDAHLKPQSVSDLIMES